MFFNLPDRLKPGRPYPLSTFPSSQVKWYPLLDGGEPGKPVQPQHEPTITAHGHSVMWFGNRVPP